MAEAHTPLTRALTLTDATSLVIGTVIGTGIFFKTAVMTQQLGTPTLVLAAWIAAGLLSLAGALTYAELGAMIPKAGGDYVFIREAYGDIPAFLYGWMGLAVAYTGAIAAIATGFAIFLGAIIPMGDPWLQHTFHFFGGKSYQQEINWQFGVRQIVAVAAIVIFSAINCLRVKFGGRVQTLLTITKVSGIAVIVCGVFLLARGATWSNLATPANTPQWSGVQAFGAAMLAALWAYNGWSNMTQVAGEIENPQRNVPRGLIVGMLVVLAVYTIINLAYFYALPLGEVITSNSTAHPDALPIATKAAQTFLGSVGTRLVSIAFVISIIGALNGTILMTARVPYAMARDGLFFNGLGDVNEATHVPIRAIIFQAVWACVLALSGTFDQLTTYSIFALWIFYGITAAAVFVLRHKQPYADAARPYRTLGYPIVPLIFILVAAWLVINTLQTSPVESIIGLILIGLGLPVYFYFRQGGRSADQKT
jgi:APA family basic amino acid/polyamine antiporter